MKKSSAVIWLIALLALLAGGIYTAVYGLDENGAGSAKSIKQGLDLAGGVSITYQVVGEENPDKEDMADTIYKLQKRVEGYSTEAQVYSEGSDRINIEIPGVSDANAILEDLGKPGSLYFIRQTDEAGELNYGYGYSEDMTSVGYILTKSIDDLIFIVFHGEFDCFRNDSNDCFRKKLIHFCHSIDHLLINSIIAFELMN